MSGETDVDVGSRIERLEEIAETLEGGEIGLETARELRAEADDHLEALCDALEVGDGEIIELDDAQIDSDASE